MPSPTLGERSTRLHWLCPSASSLVQLTRPQDADAWPRLRRDPGAMILALRHGDHPIAALESSSPHALRFVLESLGEPAQGQLDTRLPIIRSLMMTALTIAERAERLAARLGTIDTERAWCAGLLAPLGWYAIATTDPAALAQYFQDPGHRQDPVGTQTRHWGVDVSGIARRLGWRWKLPTWLTAIIGRLHLPFSTACHFGADSGLFATVQLAAAIQDTQTPGWALAPSVDIGELSHRLGIARTDLSIDIGEIDLIDFDDPYSQPLLRDLIANRLSPQSTTHSDIAALESEIDHLHEALMNQRLSEADRLRHAKLNAIAEFAAGAGHEINNPLAVISGHAQYLLAREEDPARQTALQAVIRQTHRIHAILSELMQFARPSAPRKEPLDVRAIIAAVLHDNRDLAAAKRIGLEWIELDAALPLLADPRQIQLALHCLVRNAIEAAPSDGWVRVRLESPSVEWLEIVVEDSGPGPSIEQRDYLFDPFYSGRSAGRGRGLGLPTAWRLAHEHGGDVRYQPLVNGPTRFVLSLPIAISEERSRHAA